MCLGVSFLGVEADTSTGESPEAARVEMWEAGVAGLQMGGAATVEAENRAGWSKRLMISVTFSLLLNPPQTHVLI